MSAWLFDKWHWQGCIGILFSVRLLQMAGNQYVSLYAKITAEVHHLYHSDLFLLNIIVLYHYHWWIITMLKNLMKILFRRKFKSILRTKLKSILILRIQISSSKMCKFPQNIPKMKWNSHYSITVLYTVVYFFNMSPESVDIALATF